MKNFLISIICLINIQFSVAQNITPFQEGSLFIMPLETKKDFRLPVSILREDGGLTSSLKITSFNEVHIYKSKKSQDNSSHLAHQYYMKKMKEKGFIEIFRCKDACKNILNLIATNLLPKGHSELNTLKNAKRYSYAIFHKKETIGIVITIHSNQHNVRSLIAISTLK